MNARFKLANLNRAHHVAAGVFDCGGDFVGRLLQLSTPNGVVVVVEVPSVVLVPARIVVPRIITP